MNNQLGQGIAVLIGVSVLAIVVSIAHLFHLPLIIVLNRILFLLLICLGVGIFLFGISKFYKREVSEIGLTLSLGKWIPKSWFEVRGTFTLRIQDFMHILITGVTRSGKSTLIRRFLKELARNKLGFLYVDFKGEEKELVEITESLKTENFYTDLQIFDLSEPETCLTCNLLTIFPDISTTVGFVLEVLDLDHPFYQSEAEQFLRYSLTLLDAANEPRSFENLLKLLRDHKYRSRTLSSLEKKHSGAAFFSYFHEIFEVLSDRQRIENFSGMTAKLSSLTDGPLKRILNSEKSEFQIGSILNEVRPTIIRIPGDALGELSNRIIQAFIKILPVLISQRRKDLNAKDYFIFLDEQCSYTSDSIIDILKKAGSAKVHCILTRQCDGDFDSHGNGFLSKILSACSLSFSFQVLDPGTRDTLSKLMGTSLSTKKTWRTTNGNSTGEASEREVHQFQIPPDTFSMLKPGECIVSARLPKLNFNRKLKAFSTLER